MKFSDNDKEVKEFSGSNYFAFGVHKVALMAFDVGGQEDGASEYIAVTVCDPEDGEKTDEVRVYFTEKAANYSFNTLRSIAVHNAKDASKAAAGEAVDGVTTTDELAALLNEKLIGKEAWFTKYYDPSRTYTNAKGDTKRSVNKNIYGYEPTLKPELMPSDDKAALNQVFPGAKTEANNTIPSDDDWAK